MLASLDDAELMCFMSRHGGWVDASSCRSVCGQWGIPPYLMPWLLAQGSLTKQMMVQSGGAFRVQPLRQVWQKPLRDEAQLLGVPLHQVAWVREVALYGSGDAPWVLARSVIPLKTLRGRGRRLRGLGKKSLGSLLFARQNPLCMRQISQQAQGLARRSRYVWHGQPLLVQELFLADFIQQIQSTGGQP